jgi:hypothetical protein
MRRRSSGVHFEDFKLVSPGVGSGATGECHEDFLP